VYEETASAFVRVLQVLPAIDGWKPNIRPPTLAEIMGVRMDADELKEEGYAILGEHGLWSQDDELREYRSKCKWKKRMILREAIHQITGQLNSLLVEAHRSGRLTVDEGIDEQRQQINRILAETNEEPAAWRAFDRYLTSESPGASKPFDVAFWRDARLALHEALDDPWDPVSVDVGDLSELSSSTSVATQQAAGSTGESEPKRQGGTAAEEHRCLLFLVELMRSAPQDPTSKRRLWDKASVIIPGLARRAFDRAWDRAIEETKASDWKRPGRRPKT
jgi:hypothetical protein